MAMRRTKSQEYMFFDYGVDIDSRTIYLGSAQGDWDGNENGVDFLMAEKFVKAIYLLDQKEGTINIIANNPGGDWYHGMAIYDSIAAASNHVKMTVFGYAMSMGSVIFQAADERVMSRHASMMIHYGYSGHVQNHPKIIKQWVKEEDKINKVMEDIYLKRIRAVQPDFSVHKLQKMLDFDTFFNPEEAVEMGLADSIL